MSLAWSSKNFPRKFSGFFPDPHQLTFPSLASS
jgi:hypothetical protein